MHNSVGIRHQLPDQLRVAHIALDETVIAGMAAVRQVLQVPGVGQLVQVGDVVVWMLLQQETDEVRADEACPSRHQHAHGYLYWVSQS